MSKKKSTKKTRKRKPMRGKKKLFLDNFVSKLNNISATCKHIGVSRQTYYDWINSDPDFKAEVDDLQEVIKDMIESAMFQKAIVQQDTSMLIWLSKTKLKDRGYVEKQEHEHTGNPFLELMQKASVSKNEPKKEE